MYRAGDSTEEIAEKVGINPEAVRKRLIAANEPRRTCSEAQNNRVAKGKGKPKKRKSHDD